MQAMKKLSYYLDKWKFNVQNEKNRLSYTINLVMNYARISLKNVSQFFNCTKPY